MEQLKHECGVAMIRLLKPLSYYREKYGTYCYGLNKLYLLMEKQHNRGQEGAGLGVVKMLARQGQSRRYLTQCVRQSRRCILMSTPPNGWRRTPRS